MQYTLVDDLVEWKIKALEKQVRKLDKARFCIEKDLSLLKTTMGLKDIISTVNPNRQPRRIIHQLDMFGT